jgi:hypothetical protein
MRAALGLVLVAAHGVAFVALASHYRGTELAVEVEGPLASPALALAGTVPPAIADRVTTSLDGEPPGLVRRTWSITYRGGFTRTVGAAQLVGPFQDPEARACVGRVVVGQPLLDDGKAGPGTVAGEMAKRLDDELSGESFFGIGDFVRVEGLALRWAQLAAHPEDAKLVKDAPHGYVRATATLVFERVGVPLTVVLVPSPSPTELTFRIVARAELDFGNRFVQWLSDKLGGDRFATRLARREIDGALLTALAPPPPFELPGGQILRFGFCAGPAEIIEGSHGALPFSIELGRVAGDPSILPPRRGPAPHRAIAPGAALAIDLDLDALNALLYELWRSGDLDRRLAAAGLDRRFNTDPLVRELLSIRISPPRLALPPVLAPGAHGLRMSTDARVAISDGSRTTIGRVWGGLDFSFAPGTVEPIAVDLGALALSCERTATTLVPCYADLVGALRERRGEFHPELTATFARLLADLFVDRRLGASGLPADLVIRAATARLARTADNASLHLDLDASLVASP